MTWLVVSPAEPEPELIARAADVLRRGGIVAYPTDTMYGLAADPRDDAAVARLFALKGRAAAAAIPLVASDLTQAQAAGELGAADRRLAAAFWPGPLSIVVPARALLTPRVLAGGSSVAIRVPAHPVAIALSSAHGFAITATSANRSGEPPVEEASHLSDAVRTGVDVVIDGGRTPGGPSSTLVECIDGVPIERRAGAIAWDRVINSLR